MAYEATSKGHQLLAEVNIIRTNVGREPLGEISMRGCSWNCATCAIEMATGCRLRQAITEPEERGMALGFLDDETAAQVGAALKRPYIERTREVRAGDPINSFVIAATYGLVFVDSRMILTGWIEPTDRDPSTWDLFLMPAKLYPPGHAPRTYVDPISS